MSAVELKQAGPFAFREAVPDTEPKGPPVLCLHGFPETSYMWQDVLAAIAGAGHRGIAPDRPGSGRSAPDPPATWERQSGAIGRFVDTLGIPPVVLVVHDWGGLIGLRWACDHPDRVRALVISSTGFFPDGKWHGLATGLRTPETGEQLLEALDRSSFGELMRSQGSGFGDDAIDEYWHSLGTREGRAAVLETYRSGDFEQLRPYEARLAELGLQTLILWGEDDAFAPVAGAHRFAAEIPGSKLRVIEGAGHFVYADAPAECAAAITDFLARI